MSCKLCYALVTEPANDETFHGRLCCEERALPCRRVEIIGRQRAQEGRLYRQKRFQCFRIATSGYVGGESGFGFREPTAPHVYLL
ncbi:hypothetical protein SAMN05444920_1314 [Nonomuraea solani]|uniref:Uncharacterized protein n=1 Tax=Nonomuraea solani TaxID=1144553 RepID=A0A1H6EYM8_9ACTN|nr:hypothetical protein SAMN05444920_1314 [Nonomuraea solani]